jgi:HAD superfamily phosphatase
MKPLLVFDMDGVLVDVTESYRETIARTVEHFTGSEVTRERIQDLKNEGGWNDDWKLSHHMVTKAGVDVPFDEVKKYFQSIFLGEGAVAGQVLPVVAPAILSPVTSSEALILREQWVAKPGTLERLNQTFRFAIFTGRPRPEAELTLNRFAPSLVFDPIICMDEVENHKPAPDGLLRILRHNCDCKVFYIGDTVDDARCAKAAKVPFIGIAAPANPRYIDLVFLFQAEGAYAIVDDINYLEEVFAS